MTPWSLRAWLARCALLYALVAVGCSLAPACSLRQATAALTAASVLEDAIRALLPLLAAQAPDAAAAVTAALAAGDQVRAAILAADALRALPAHRTADLSPPVVQAEALVTEFAAQAKRRTP